MDYISIASRKKKISIKEIFKNKNTISFLFVVFGFVLYLLFLSPIIESKVVAFLINDNISDSNVTLNYLTAMHEDDVFASEYTINTIGSQDKFDLVKSLTEIQTEDARVMAMQKFLRDYNSPMAPYAKTFVEEADRHGLDWRLVASISGVESAFGNIIPNGTHNGWGWRGQNPNANGWSQFSDWGEAIQVVTERLALGYGTNLTPYQIEPSYCPPCYTGGHAWARGVTGFMNELDYYLDNLDSI